MMGVGLQVFGESGEITLDSTYRLTKVIGIETLSGDGEISFHQYPDMLPWYFVLVPPVYSSKNLDVPVSNAPKPILRIDEAARKIFWKYVPPNGAKIIYGVY